MVSAFIVATFLGAAPGPRFDNPPPGQIIQDVVAYLSGEGMSSRWHVVASHVLAGRQMGKTPVYQWYLSIYSPAEGDVSKLAYRSPGTDSTLLAKVAKAPGAQMYFPMQELKIVGPAELERPTVQDVVIWSHQSGADCGLATVTILGADQSMRVRVRKQVQNYCRLDANIVRRGDLQDVQLSGPFYKPTSPVAAPRNRMFVRCFCLRAASGA